MAAMSTEKVREIRLCRKAVRRGWRLERSRCRGKGARVYGGYMLIDIDTNAVLLGGSPWPYSATLNEVEAYTA